MEEDTFDVGQRVNLAKSKINQSLDSGNSETVEREEIL